MSLTHRELALVQDSLHTVRREIHSADTLFYDRLFARNPQMRRLFPDDTTGLGMKFLGTLEMVLESITRPEGYQAELRDLADGHAAMGVKAHHYAPLGDALIDTIHDLLGTDFTEEVKDAWQAAYAVAAARMMAADAGITHRRADARAANRRR